MYYVNLKEKKHQHNLLFYIKLNFYINNYADCVRNRDLIKICKTETF